MLWYTDSDLLAIGLTLKLAAIVTVLLMIVSTPLAWWLARTHSRLKGPISALVALPLVLPPSVLGFYMLAAMGPQGPLGALTSALNLGTLAFSFQGLVIASMIYSLPFVVQPIQNAIESLGSRPLEAAATLRAGPIDTFFSVALPLCKTGFLSAAIMGFAHTVGEFGVVLMIGGNIPGETQVVSVQLYDHVEALDYKQAHTLAATLLGFSFVVLLSLYSFNHSTRHRAKRARA